MNHAKKADLQTLGDFADYLQNACEKNGIAPLTPFNSRRFATAPDKVEFAAYHGIDILRLESRGIYSPDSDNSTYARLLEEQLNRDFWPSNNTHQLGLPSMEPLPQMGTTEQPTPAGDLPSSLSRYLQQTPPASLRALASLLLGGVARAKSRDPSKRPKDSFEPSSRKTKTGRREYAKAPTFQQWAQKAGIKLTWLSQNAVSEATKVFNRLLEDILVVNFWPRHRNDERKRGIDRTVPALEKQIADKERVVQPGSVTLAARRGAPAREVPLARRDVPLARDGLDATDLPSRGLTTGAPNPLAPRAELGRQTGDLGKIALWLESSFVDYDPALVKTFLQRFPRTTLDAVLDVARTLWRQVDGRQSDEKYVNLQKFLHRLSAVDTLKAMRPKWSPDELQNFVYFELNHIYATVTAGCQIVCNTPLDPYDLILKLPTMPILLDMTDAELTSAVQRVLTVAAKAGQSSSPQQYMEAVAVAVRSGGASKEQQENILALAKEITATDAAKPAEAPFAAPAPLGVGGDTLYALQNARFGLRSTQEMVKTAMRRGLDPVRVHGPEWVVPSGIGGGDIDGHRRKEALLKAQVEEAIREIRADYGVEAGRAKMVQEKITEARRDRNNYGTSVNEIKNAIAAARRRETKAINAARKAQI